MDAEANAKFKAANQLPYPILVDRDGAVGHLYDAKTTPHMYVIDAEGNLVYMGAIDDDPRGGNQQPKNYVAAALDEILAGKPVTTAETTPYGCSVKYKK
jgi:peroxiredoxin